MTDIPILFVLEWFRTGLSDSGLSAFVLSTIGVGAGLLGAMVTWGFNLWRTRLTQRQIDLASQNSRYDRFQRGIEMLGSPDLFVRLGGIYALRALMKEDPQELHIPAVELICAFLRNPIDADKVTRGSSVRQDIQTALEVLVGRGEAEVALEKARGFSLDLRNANLEYAQLSGIDLSGGNLRGTKLSYSNINNANLSKTMLNEADLSFVNCRNSDLRRASLVRANLRHVSADSSDCSDAIMYWVNCAGGSFHKTTFANIKFSSCDFKGALLYEADLTRTYLQDGNIITQQQLDKAVAEPSRPPFIDDGFVDPDTGKQLNWHGETPPAVIARQRREQQEQLAEPKPPGRDINFVIINRINSKPPSTGQAGYS